MLRTLRSFAENEVGEVAVSYGLIAALVALSAIVGWEALGNANANSFENTLNRMEEGLNRSGFWGP